MTFRSCAAIVLGLAPGCSDPQPPEGPKGPTAVEPVLDARGAEAGGEQREDATACFAGLETRDYEVWLHAGEPCLYTVKSKDGRVLARALDEAGLERDYPELHALLFNAVDTLGPIDDR